MTRDEKIIKIKEFLKDNQALSSMQVSYALNDMGISVSPDMITKHRRRFNLPYINPKNFTNAIVEDYKSGKRFKNGREMASYYGCSPSHAKKTIRALKMANEKRTIKSQVIINDYPVKPAVPVNSMAFYIQQLCA